MTLLTTQGEDAKVIESFRTALDNGGIKLILPEVIIWEYSRKVDEEYKVIRKNIGKLKDYINKEMPKGGIFLGDRVIKEINDSLDKISGGRKDYLIIAKEKVQALFRHNNTIRIPITQETILTSLRHSIEGKKPFDIDITNYFQPDVILVLAASSYLKNNEAEHLIVCSNDLKAFSKREKAEKDKIKSPVYEPNDDIKTLFPSLEKCYRFLTDLLKYELGSKIDEDKLSITEQIMARFREQNNIGSGAFRYPPPYNRPDEPSYQNTQKFLQRLLGEKPDVYSDYLKSVKFNFPVTDNDQDAYTRGVGSD